MQTVDTQLALASFGSSAPGILLIIFGGLIAIPLVIVAIIYLVVPAVKGLIWLVKHLFTFIFGMIGDALRLIGTVLTTLILVPLVVGNVFIGRWSASAHYGRAIQGEIKTAGRSFYRLAIGHVAKLLCLGALTEGIERRIPEVVAAAPGSDRPSRRVGQFDGYTIVGSLAGGGSGGKLYVAKPSEQKLAAFARGGATGVDQVVIKCFTLGDGSSLPQIVRENRALDAAKRLGLILEHDLNNDRFFYVMRYVPGESLNLVTQRLHAMSGGGGLARRELSETLEYTGDLLRTLAHYHAGGLWHKDVKPDNIIVCDGQAHLVDFGLITPLRSSMTLTTHGTEYFRDPEMVRLALKGVKVQDVDGAKFDLYAVGAVLYSMIENSFPAHGGLSQISRTCPEAVRMIVRRAMTDYDKRYPSAMDMLADVETVLRAQDPFAMKLIALPSMRSAGEDGEAGVGAAPQVQAAAWGGAAPAGGAGAGMPPPIPGHGAASPGWNSNWQEPVVVGAAAGSPRHAAPAGRVRPKLRVTNWWQGTYVVENEAARVAPNYQAPRPAANPPRTPWGTPAGSVPAAPPPIPGVVPVGGHRAGTRMPSGTAAEQIRRARDRARAAQDRVRSRMRDRNTNYASGMNVGVTVAIVLFGVVFIGFMALFAGGRHVMQPVPSRAVVMSRSTPGDVVMVPTAPVIPRVEIADRVPQPTNVAASDGAAWQTVSEDHETKVVVACNWSKYGAKQQRALRSSLKELASAGFELVGDTEPGATPRDEDLEIVAELRKAIGTRLFLSNDAKRAITDWAQVADGPVLVLWIGQSPAAGEGDAPTTWLISPDGVSREVSELARQKLIE